MSGAENITGSKKVETPVEKTEALRQRFQTLRSKMGVDEKFDFMGACMKYGEVIDRAYKKMGKDPRAYKAFHLLDGSSVEEDGRQIYYDFPEPEFSIENFIKKYES